MTFWQKVGEAVIDHWKLLLILLIGLAGVIALFTLLNKEPVPDVKILFFSSSYTLPDKTKENLQDLLASYTEDANNDSAQYAKVYSYYFTADSTADSTTGSADVDPEMLKQLLDDDTFYVIFADPDTYTWLVDNGYVAKLGQFTTNRSDIEPDALGFLVSDSTIFGYVTDSTLNNAYNAYLSYLHDDYGLSSAFADYHVVFKTGDYDELTGDALTAYDNSCDFYKAVMSTIVAVTTSAE